MQKSFIFFIMKEFPSYDHDNISFLFEFLLKILKLEYFYHIISFK